MQKALNAKSEEKRRDDSFAHAVLRLKIVDPAMGSGHFLVRATEWLAQKLFEHTTTARKTEQIVPQGKSRRSREDILRHGGIPVSQGLSQEQAELGYWRRRVVEACIYGVDLNPMAVELTKLSLWLTCIATDEPLNFLDHHLRFGNSLLGVPTVRLSHAPLPQKEQSADTPFNIGNRLTNALKSAIEENVNIEESASTEMELVKKKEERWKAVRHKLDPYQATADLWMAILSGLPLDDFQYRKLALLEIAPSELSEEDKGEAPKLRKSLSDRLSDSKTRLAPFHWELEFPAVFFNTDGQPRPESSRGFDAVLGNPPYISTHTSSEESWRTALERHAGYLEDLYVHFTDLGFQLLRPGGNFGFIVSDTFFTLASKLRMREMLQNHSLLYLGQCDPFEATVDAAIFVARKGAPQKDDRLVFLQARRRRTNEGKITMPEDSLPRLPARSDLKWNEGSTEVPRQATRVDHASFECLRLHQAPLPLYGRAHKRVFFEPRPATLKLFDRFNDPVKRLVEEWWAKIETSQKFADNAEAIRPYHKTLKPGDITLVGLIADGGQGMRTANNARFLAYLEGTPQAQELLTKRDAWTRQWLANAEIRAAFVDLFKQHGGNAQRPTANSAAWEACVEPIKSKFGNDRLGFNKTDLYRIVPKALVACQEDFDFAWKRRKAELLARWQNERIFSDFWQREALFGEQKISYKQLQAAKDISDSDFCRLCVELQAWAAGQKQIGIRDLRDALGLRSSETYTIPEDAPRIATIYNGLSGRGIFVPFRKGDPEGNRWVDNEPLYIDWSQDSVSWLSTAPAARWQGQKFFFTSGVTWTAVANHVAMKARYQEPCVFDADSMRLTPCPGTVDPLAFLALFNADVVSFIKMKFIKHTQKWEIGDLRHIPLVVPGKPQERHLSQLASAATECKKLTFTGEMLNNETTAFIKGIAQDLVRHAPQYLRPPALLFTSPADGLAILQRAINWEAEKLYGVEGLGPFDEF